MVICVRAFLCSALKEIGSGKIPERGWLNAVERVLKFSVSSMGRRVARELGVDWEQALPLVEIAISKRRAAVALREKRLDIWRTRLAPALPRRRFLI
jgi:hypothetical protein